MGLRRLRGRLNQVQGHANATLGAADDLLADLRDGVGVTLRLDVKLLQDMITAVFGTATADFPDTIDLPLTVVIDPQVDAEK